MATQHLLKGGPSASFTSPKQFFQWCFEKNDHMVVARSCSLGALTSATSRMSEPNSPIEIRWLPADLINIEYEKNLRHRWNQLSSRDSITGIRDIHQFDAHTNGSISCHRISESDTTTSHRFKILAGAQPTVIKNMMDEQ
ncbi:unnamed protein product [Rotaria sp. Silwood2]|nr:unnamed protein product [Rotaria sp. Silwood2]